MHFLSNISDKLLQIMFYLLPSEYQCIITIIRWTRTTRNIYNFVMNLTILLYFNLLKNIKGTPHHIHMKLPSSAWENKTKQYLFPFLFRSHNIYKILSLPWPRPLCCQLFHKRSVFTFTKVKSKAHAAPEVLVYRNCVADIKKQGNIFLSNFI